jgi:hypothetical protein
MKNWYTITHRNKEYKKQRIQIIGPVINDETLSPEGIEEYNKIKKIADLVYSTCGPALPERSYHDYMVKVLREHNYIVTQDQMHNYKINNEHLLQTQIDLLDENNNNFPEYEMEEKKDKNVDDYKPNKMFKKNLKNIMYQFVNANNEKKWPETTNIYCWWCCHPFQDMPCALPENYNKDKFYVFGCFCSFNCTAAYNFSKNDENMWERYTLLNLMYKKLFHSNFVKISCAPVRESLKIFGGYLSIEEFRENCLKNDKTLLLIKPPLISIIPKIEENMSYKNNKTNNSLVNENILNKTHTSLKLKRNKPITNPNNTLQSFMDLKII